ncbi:WD40-repeat-containing domain protein [Fennellomyces sp. T-0311]|nr:WD40-repeat-containing domain protein [Fennellomyces sp. T-0311]
MSATVLFGGHKSVYDFLQRRRRGQPFRRVEEQHKILQAIHTRSVATLTENPIDLKDHDKIFTSAWISTSKVVVGTKEDKLLVIDIINPRESTNVPLIKYRELPSAPSTSSSQRQNKSNESARAAQTKESNDESTVYMREPVTPSSLPSLQRFQQKKCEGIRGLSVNPSKTLLAVGLADPPVVMVYHLPDFTPAGITIRTHRDAVFSVQWLDDITFVTGSRDGSLGLWKLTDDDGVQQHISLVWTSHTAGFAPRIRDTKLTAPHTAASLAVNGIVQIWDLNECEKLRDIQLRHTKELVCMAAQQQGNLLAIGSQEHVTLVDSRLSLTASAAQEFQSQDQDWGVRSLAFQGHIVTCGGGFGRVSFYDIRNKAFITSFGSSITDPPSYCSVSSGWLDEGSPVYQTYFYGQHRLTPQAVYTLEYSPDDSRKLFTAGGPIQNSLRGCYAAVWS